MIQEIRSGTVFSTKDELSALILIMKSRIKQWLLRGTLVFLSIGFAGVCCELTLRIYQYVRYRVPMWGEGLSQASVDSTLPGARLPNMLDPRLGWRSTPNFRYQGTGLESDGSTYFLTVTKNSLGFRAFGDLSSSKPKILVIGDSYTEALEVSDDQTYYTLIGRILGCEVFAIGSGGYGSLQEYMLLDQFKDLTIPNLILWQFCFNDFMNNCYRLDR